MDHHRTSRVGPAYRSPQEAQSPLRASMARVRGSWLKSPPQEEPPAGTGRRQGLAREEEEGVVAGAALQGSPMPYRESGHYTGGHKQLLKSLGEWMT